MPGSSKRAADSPLTERVGFLLSKLGFCATDRLAERLAPLGLRARHFELLSRLADAEGVSQQQLADAMGLHRNQMVKLVDDLEDRQLVERRPHPDDRRAHALFLTDRASTLLSHAQRAADEHEADFTAALNRDEAREFARLLRRVADHAGVTSTERPESPDDDRPSKPAA
jgi:DNA-binding MarR family transcriptional regulator